MSTTTETSTTSTDPAAEPNVTAPLPDEIAESADTEQHPAEHDAPATTSTEDDGTGQEGGSAHELRWLGPATLRVHPRNVRDDLGDLTGLADSIAAQGVLEALTVVPHERRRPARPRRRPLAPQRSPAHRRRLPRAGHRPPPPGVLTAPGRSHRSRRPHHPGRGHLAGGAGRPDADVPRSGDAPLPLVACPART